MAIGATAATLLGSGVLASSAIGSTVAGNKSNASIAQQNNAFNEKMLQKQMDYNTQMYQQQLGDQWKFYNDAKQNSWDMFNASNEYNSASAQRERLEAAGLNPYLMMSGGSAGTATAQSSAQGSVPSAQGINPPTATPYSADYSGITQSLGIVLDKIATQPDRDLILRIIPVLLNLLELCWIRSLLNRIVILFCGLFRYYSISWNCVG